MAVANNHHKILHPCSFIVLSAATITGEYKVQHNLTIAMRACGNIQTFEYYRS